MADSLCYWCSRMVPLTKKGTLRYHRWAGSEGCDGSGKPAGSLAGLKKFTDVDFCREYPRGRVAEHEVFMSFNNDDDAIAFQDWWNAEGAAAFGKWLPRATQDP